MPSQLYCRFRGLGGKEYSAFACPAGHLDLVWCVFQVLSPATIASTAVFVQWHECRWVQSTTSSSHSWGLHSSLRWHCCTRIHHELDCACSILVNAGYVSLVRSASAPNETEIVYIYSGSFTHVYNVRTYVIACMFLLPINIPLLDAVSLCVVIVICSK